MLSDIFTSILPFHAVSHPKSIRALSTHGVIHPCTYLYMESSTHAVIYPWSYPPMQSHIHGVIHPCSHPCMHASILSFHSLVIYLCFSELGLADCEKRSGEYRVFCVLLLYSFVDYYKLMIVMIILTDDSAMQGIPQDCIGQRVMMTTTIADCRPVY